MVEFFEGQYEALSLFVRHSAWLNAVPKVPGKKIDGSKSVSRLQVLLDAGENPSMPPVDAQYLISYLFEIGPTISGPMGNSPLSHGELAAWQANIGIDLKPWEARFLRGLSIEYLVQAQKSEMADCPAPYGTEERRALVAKKIDDVFG